MPADRYPDDAQAAVARFDPPAFARTFTHASTLVDGVKLHSVSGGRGPHLLLLHGWPASWFEFRKLMPLLADRFTVSALDLPGMGDSGPAPDYRKPAVAALVAKWVEQELGGPVDLVGHDVGGPVAFALAAAFPHLVRRLALVETMLAGPHQDAMQTAAFPNLWHLAFNAAPGVAESLTAGREAAYVGQFFAPWSHNPAAITPDDAAEYARIYSAPGKLPASLRHYRHFPEDAAANLPHKAAKLTLPVLHIVGADSMGRMGSAPADSVRECAADVTAETLDRCGHWVADERPVTLAARLTAFFEEK